MDAQSSTYHANPKALLWIGSGLAAICVGAIIVLVGHTNGRASDAYKAYIEEQRLFAALDTLNTSVHNLVAWSSETAMVSSAEGSSSDGPTSTDEQDAVVAELQTRFTTALLMLTERSAFTRSIRSSAIAHFRTSFEELVEVSTDLVKAAEAGRPIEEIVRLRELQEEIESNLAAVVESERSEHRELTSSDELALLRLMNTTRDATFGAGFLAICVLLATAGVLSLRLGAFLDEIEARDDQLRNGLAESERQQQHLEAQAGALTKARAAAEAANSAKSEFLSTISHEIRTPMNGVLGMLGLLLEGELGADERRYASLARDSAENLLVLINDVLDYSKLEAGRTELEVLTFNVGHVVRGVADLMRVRAETKGLTLDLEVAPGLPPWISSDPTRLRQILFNLVGNAVKFTEKGRIIVSVSHQEAGEGAIEVRFGVTDSGIGLAAEAQERIFDRFTQADSSSTRVYGGTGLGLAISKKLAVLMGGNIGVESERGRGSRFWFTIRCRPAQAPPTREALASEETVELPKLRVLVAEDSVVNQIFMAQLLRRRGHVVDVAANGAEAVHAVQKFHYDVVLMDVQMPEMDGPAATAAIRKLPTAAANVPIIALTANAMEGHRERYLAAGMDDYVSKPVSTSLLFQAMARLTKNRTGIELSPPSSDGSANPSAEAALERKPKRPAKARAKGAAAKPLLPLLDQSTVAALVDGLGPESLAAIFGAVPGETAKCLNEIKSAIAAGDLSLAKRAAHRLKGLAGNLGAARLAAEARTIEVDTPALEILPKRLKSLEKVLSSTLKEMRKVA